MPRISKGKTFNGLYTGIIFTVIIACIYYLKVYNGINAVLLLVFPIIVLSFLGDLIVSVLKRSVNIKDSGHIMPGHG